MTTSDDTISRKDAEQAFLQGILDLQKDGREAQASLHTDDRVMARITDGIYRQPSSALRELISNAYDADATEVYIETDVPRFSQIRIRDNGRGMDETALSRLVFHIGGSSKRTRVGADIGTTSANDSDISPRGRKLIGKIGIGLFSVSQLTSHFQIITKVKGTQFRLVADVILKTYSEDAKDFDNGPFESGSVRVTSVPATDTESHGTEIILLSVRPRARDLLRSKDLWEQYLENNRLPTDKQDPRIKKPVRHVGYLSDKQDPESSIDSYVFEPCLPWDNGASAIEKFRKLFDSVADEVGITTERPDLAGSLDSYLATLWALGLSAPVQYIDRHPFELTSSDNIILFKLLNDKRGRSERVELQAGQTVRSALGMINGSEDPAGGFSVFVDGIELRRPIKFEYLKIKKAGIGKALMFVGRYKPDLSNIASDIRGGGLEYEGYLFLNSRIVPKENNGVLVRINGSSGALFDDTFMKYQVSELTRLRQITSEIFVYDGLDAALNIDRESFNFAHPHYQILSRWLHRSLRQLANTHKALGDESRQELAKATREQAQTQLKKFASDTWTTTRRDESDSPPEVEIVESPIEASVLRKEGSLVFDASEIAALKVTARDSAAVSKLRPEERSEREEMLKALATVLDGFGVLRDMSYVDQHALMEALLQIYFTKKL